MFVFILLYSWDCLVISHIFKLLSVCPCFFFLFRLLHISQLQLIMNRPLRTFLTCMLRVRTDLASSRTSSLCPYTCIVPSRLQSTGVKTRSYLQYVKRKILAPKAPPYCHVCQVGDPVLRCSATDVEPAAVQGAEVQRVINTMVTVMRRLKCVGLSAPQLGVPLRIIAMEYTEKMLQENPPAVIEARGLVSVPLKVFINPQLRVLNGQTVNFQEACESISGFSASVPRYISVEVSGDKSHVLFTS